MFLSCLDWGYGNLLEHDKVKSPFHHIISRVHPITMTYHWCYQGYLTGVALVSFLQHTAILFPPSIQFYSLEGSHCAQIILNVWGVMFHPLGKRVSTSSLWFFSMGHLSILPHLFTCSIIYSLVQSFIHINMGSWMLIYTLWYDQTYVIDLVTQIVPSLAMGRSLSWPLFFRHIPINVSLSLSVLRTFLLSRTTGCSKLTV